MIRRLALLLVIALAASACSSSTSPSSSSNYTLIGSWVGAPVPADSLVDSVTFASKEVSGGWRNYSGHYAEHGGTTAGGAIFAKQDDPSGNFVDIQFGVHEFNGNFTDANTIIGTVAFDATTRTYRLNRIP